MVWNVGGIRFLAGDVDRCREQQMASGRSTLLRSASLWRVAIALPVAACSYSPTLDLLGSYFPAWMLCAAIGIVAAVIIRQILAVTGINDFVVAPLLTYTGLAVSATLVAWLLWFGH
jgi:YtcA family